MTMTAKRILVTTLSNIGDAVMTTPVLAALHARFPDACIALFCDPRSSVLRQTRYDIIVDLRTAFLGYLLRATRRLNKYSNAIPAAIYVEL
ncbi:MULTISPECIES: glycosyltransferase family 9 protein [unclassified Methylophilus]|uniref:glycosyltransferase family 9 protein n=1 Tax=unclassified Methylophilus TaxID=2630143 RepID=UPI0003A93C4E|nr:MULTISPECIES: hypothetical protein [unclassified Methylophilus]